MSRLGLLFTLAALLVSGGAAFAAQNTCDDPFDGVTVRFSTSYWTTTDFCTRSIDLSGILSGGPPPDGIPPIDNPQFESIASASEWLASVTEQALAKALEENADEPAAALLARELTQRRMRTPITRTLQLADAIRASLRASNPRRDPETDDDCVRRVFQAIRIAVNDEFGALEMFLRQLPTCVNAGGRIAILTFHSGEDRRVKQAFREGLHSGIYSAINDEVIRAGPDERRSNPRSSSAKLRWAVKS